jgi:hypothetical protein
MDKFQKNIIELYKYWMLFNAKIYKKIVKNKKLYKPSIIVDQDYLNNVSYDQIGILPLKFGLTPYQTILAYLKYTKLTKNYQYLKNQKEINSQDFNLNPVFIHQWNGKWALGRGLTIYRRIAKYYIRFAGIWDEICKEYPGACKRKQFLQTKIKILSFILLRNFQHFYFKNKIDVEYFIL